MMRHTLKLQHLVGIIRKEPTNENLVQAVITLTDCVVNLQRELDRVNAVASRADRNARMMHLR